jgi:hypothetical protein
LSKKTLWGTSPKVKVTVPPTPMATFAGVKVFSEVAFTAAAMGGGEGLLDDPGSVDELHAAARATTAQMAMIRGVRMARVREAAVEGSSEHRARGPPEQTW